MDVTALLRRTMNRAPAVCEKPAWSGAAIDSVHRQADGLFRHLTPPRVKGERHHVALVRRMPQRTQRSIVTSRPVFTSKHVSLSTIHL